MPKQKMKIPKSIKIYIRKEKARIRKASPGLEERQKRIEEMYKDLGLSQKDEH